ncbi:MAG: amidinotransferase [Bacteroidales bacterium]|nr:amidinotransferase [Bacteroidales bacterium]
MQTTGHIFMVRPAFFGYNSETAVNNAFQSPAADVSDMEETARRAGDEFDRYVEMLRREGVSVEVRQDTASPSTPDSIFPNNCFSTHLDYLADGTASRSLVFYPMFARNRREERPKIMAARDSYFDRIIDLSGFEKDGLFLEGTGSLILDRERHFAYACASPRTDETVLEEWAEVLGYSYFLFDACDAQGTPVYHTNVMMHVGTSTAVVCIEAVRDSRQRIRLTDLLERSGKTIVPITLDQMAHFAGNMLELRSNDGRKLLVMSATAKASLTPEQLAVLGRDTTILAPELGAIEKAGGGSARCMIAEIF